MLTPTATTVPVFDAVQLNRYTNGDSNMQVEVLALFVAEVERLMQQIDAALDAEMRAQRMSALAGLARTTGATLLAQRARAAAADIGKEDFDMAPLEDAVAQTLAYVRRTGI